MIRTTRVNRKIADTYELYMSNSNLWRSELMGGIVKKFNPRKASALSHKRNKRRGDCWVKSVDIREITFNEVKQDAIDFGLAAEVTYQAKSRKEASICIAKWGEPFE
jgi:hypothetical protein